MSELIKQAQREVLRDEILKLAAQSEPVGASLQVLRWTQKTGYRRE